VEMMLEALTFLVRRMIVRGLDLVALSRVMTKDRRKSRRGAGITLKRLDRSSGRKVGECHSSKNRDLLGAPDQMI